MKWPVWTLLIRCSLASVLAETRTRAWFSGRVDLFEGGMECQRKPAAVWHQPQSCVSLARTKPEPALREFRDPNGRLFRLNLKTGATEWEDEKSQRSGEPGHADLEDWLRSDPAVTAAEEVRKDLALDLGMWPAPGGLRRESRPGQASALKAKAEVETKPSEQKILESQALMSLMEGSDLFLCVCAILFT